MLRKYPLSGILVYEIAQDQVSMLMAPCVHVLEGMGDLIQIGYFLNINSY